MRNINVIDLDRTLIPYDSFRILVLSYLRGKKYLTPVAFYTLLRKLRIIKADTFKYKVLVALRQDRHYQDMMHDLKNRILSEIRPEIMEIIQRETGPDTINILVSASPSDYVNEVAQGLGWPYLASDVINGKFIHCYGGEKRELVLSQYPKHKFMYNFAISDALSDLSLLEMFRKYKIVKNRHSCMVQK
ncbi:MAG: haloacid dehalogenase-like hydrolase [Syntrophales bacterium]|jgi:phosphoserine phosphatase|nr:haloacid dehalogenase-like hydrolase [Syntrophales bacterium]MCK9528851.1 haloacid dehalogenase-like hydrolase [Syntrophales bacterium]MDX9921055.1 haloacid dehalogenase-like hydrolase [Syntrophales bacterium]